MRSHPSIPPCRTAVCRRAPVWLPWLAAPAFMLLPIAGCGAAASLRHGGTVAAVPAEQPPPLVPTEAVVTALPPAR